jgi:hypothetical protein
VLATDALVWDALFWVVSAVLVAAGVAKVADPAGTAEAFAALGVPGGRAAARGVGALEVGLGVAGLSVGGTAVAAGVAAVYVVFAAVVVAARRRGLPSCGCFGARSAPPSPVHAVVDLASAGVAAEAAVGGAAVPTDALAGLLAPTAAVVLGLVALAAALAVVVDTVVAEVVEATAALRAQADGGAAL